MRLTADGGLLNIPLPDGEWTISGIVVEGRSRERVVKPRMAAKESPRPAIAHDPPSEIDAGQALTLKVRISPAHEVTRVRLYYRAVNQQAKFKAMEIGGGEDTFTIPGEDIAARWDLMYYFEALNGAGGGWFHPDPRIATPYFVVKVRGAK